MGSSMLASAASGSGGGPPRTLRTYDFTSFIPDAMQPLHHVSKAALRASSSRRCKPSSASTQPVY